MTRGNQGEVSTTQIIYAILTMVVIGFILVLFLKIDLSKYFSFLPSFGNSNEDKVIEGGGEFGGAGATGDWDSGLTDSLKEGETCCCLYENMKNTEECRGTKLELNEYCKDKLGNNWVNSDDKYCEK